MCLDTACAAAIWEIKYYAISCCLRVHRPMGDANLGDEEWAKASSFSAPRFGIFDILFVGGHEAVCAVATEPPPPIPRPPSRPLDLSDACAHPSAARSRASRVASGRDGRAPHVQGSWVGWVDDVGRASAASGLTRRAVHACRAQTHVPGPGHLPPLPAARHDDDCCGCALCLAASCMHVGLGGFISLPMTEDPE